ncbi:MAG: T9SS type A sorting domain-containing protein [Bacteroidetes bacterium]|nr:T9SS type A sorting domain-containing protein [Bacteroidota bacterium]
MNKFENKIYIGDLQSGFYILQITLKSKKIITEKIIIEN